MGAAENKAAVTSGYEAFARGDVESVVAMNAPDAVWVIHNTPSSPLHGEHKGPDGIAALFGLIGQTIDMTGFALEPIAAEGDTVVTKGEQAYVVKSTGKSVSGPLIHIWTFGADGKVTRFEEFEIGVEHAWS